MSDNHSRVQSLLQKTRSEQSVPEERFIGKNLSKRSGDKLLIIKPNNKISDNLLKNIYNSSVIPSVLPKNHKHEKDHRTENPETFLQSYPPLTRRKIKLLHAYWLTLGLVKPSAPNTIISSYKAYNTMLSRYPIKELKRLFKLYAEVLKDPDSKFFNRSPFRVAPHKFIQWDYREQKSVQKYPFLKNDTSLFQAFTSRTITETRNDFYKLPPDNHPEVTKAIKKTWAANSSKIYDAKKMEWHCRKISNRFVTFWKANKHKIKLTGFTTREKKIVEVIATRLIGEFLETINSEFELFYLNSDNFFNRQFPKFLLERRTMASEEEVVYVNQLRKERRKPRRASSFQTDTRPDWMRR